MKFLHTSDLHLGLKLCEYQMNEDLRYLLNEIRDIAERESCDAVVIAGDIYDRSNPSPESVAIFDEFVTSLSRNNIAVMGIYGNHDSAERIAYLSDILKLSGVYFSPAYNGKIEKAVLHDEYGEVNFYLLPFVRPGNMANIFPDYSGEGYTDAVNYQINAAGVDFSARNVIVTHHFVAEEGTAFSDDEAGGTGRVLPETFNGFDYTALGHLHMPHSVKKSNIRYSGSPMKCSFSEAAGEKSVTIVTLGRKGDTKIETAELHPIHDLREISGTYEELTSLEARQSGNREDYLRIILKDEDDIPDAVAKLRTVYPNLMRLSYDNTRTRENKSLEYCTEHDSLSDALTPAKIFSELYELQNNAPPGDEINAIVNEIISEIGDGT